jgi:serine/threonine protein kinase
MGSVYLAEMVSGQNFRRQIAVKVIKTEEAGASPFITRMRDEARLLGLLQDDEILQVINLVNIQGRDAILMEYVEGEDLSKIGASGLPLSPKALVTIGAITAGVLHRAHTAVDPRTRLPLNVVHRDIKPANIMVTRNGGVKVCDFGVAKARFEGQESQTSPDQILGTLHYMSPEYLRTGEISPAADILALGISLIELLSGRKFGRPKLKRAEHDDSVAKLLQAARLAPKLSATLKQCLEWNPNSRPTAARLEDELYNIAESLPGLSLRRWASQTLPQLERQTGPSDDPLGLLGQTITMSEQSFILEPGSTLDSPAPNLTSTPIELTPSLTQEEIPTAIEKHAILYGAGIGILLFLLTLPLYFVG